MSDRVVMVYKELPFDAAQWERLRAAFQPDTLLEVSAKDEAAVARGLQHAEIAIITSDLDQRFIDAPKLKWVHCDHAGLTKSARPAVFEKHMKVTGSAGRSGVALAEHAIMFMLMLGSNYPAFYEAQKRHQWGGVPATAKLRALYGRTVGIVGMGYTGVELASRCKAFNMTVLGYRRRDLAAPAGVDRMYSADLGATIDPILDQCDFLALTVNLSDATHHMIGKPQLDRMKLGAIIVNLSRGGVIDEPALIAALQSGKLGGAGLDVTETEPLPATSPLWDAPNTLITPHFTASLPDKTDRSLRVIIDNIGHFRNGTAMRNQITKEDLYTK